MKNIAYTLVLLAFLAPFAVHAESVLRVGDNISVDAKQVVDGNYYVSAGPVGTTNMSGSVKGDMYAFGGMVNTNGPVGNDLTIVSGTAQVHAPVSGDVRIVSGQVTVADHVGGDLFVMGGTLQVLSTASVDGDVFFFGGQGEINGKVGGSIMGSAKELRINASVGKDVDVKTASTLTLGDEANISGALRYASPEKLVRAQNAVVSGEITQNSYRVQDQDPRTLVQHLLMPLFITLFTALSLYLLFRKELQSLSLVVHHQTLKSGLIGIGVLVLGPVAAFLLIITVLGSLVGFICLALVALAYLVGYVASGIVLGTYLSVWFAKKNLVTLPFLLFGTVLIQLIFLVPVFGPIVVFALISITAGGLVLGVYKLLS